MKYLLDTNACIVHLRGTNAAVTSRLAMAGAGNVALPTVVKAELRYGAERSADPAKNHAQLQRLFASLPSLPFDDSAADVYGQIRADLEARGTPIGPNDLMIAATALSAGMILVTHSMSTLAHELGHAYHSFVLRDQPLFLQQYPMNLAETASTFAEAVLAEQRLRESESAAEQIEILDAILSDAVTFLMNIHARFLFEDHFYRERPEGELSAARLSEMMLAAQKEAFQDGLADDGWNPSFWISKLHFYISGWPFYNFPYTFGYLLSLGVYALGSEGGGDFPQQYRQLLIATGCQDAEQAVQTTLGYDLTGAEFWNKSLDIVQQRVERFLSLTG